MARCGSCGGNDRYTTCRCLVVDDPDGSTEVHGTGASNDPYWVAVVAGSSGPPGPEGPPGTLWFTGSGPPADPYPDPEARAGDLYLDEETGDYYRLTSVIAPMLARTSPDGILALI